ncbi:hypothetical protein MMC27_007096 [Xylographa pallens]|nr:hypothetical protein [Xylographa pallens]
MPRNKKNKDDDGDKGPRLQMDPENLTTQALRRVEAIPVVPGTRGITKSYEGVVVFEQDGHVHTVGGFASEEGFSTKAKIVFDVNQDWTSWLRIEIALRDIRPSELNEELVADYLHTWTLRVSAMQGDIEPDFFTFSNAPGITDSYEEAFNQYVAVLPEYQKVRKIRRAGNLVFFQFQIIPEYIHDQGVRVDDLDLDLPTRKTHRYLRAMLNDGFDSPIIVTSFIQIPGGDYTSLIQEVKSFCDRMHVERYFHPLHKWYKGLNNFLPQIQKGLVTEFNQRPIPHLQYVRSYPNMEHFITCIGFAVLQAEENEAYLIKQLGRFEVELRLIKTNMGRDMAYCCMLRCPNEFPVRIQDTDSFMVYFKGDEKPWSAHTLSTPLPWANTTDLTMTLSRPRNEAGDGWSELKLPVFDVSTMRKEPNHRTIVDFCYHSEPIKATVKLIHSDKPTKAMLAGLKKMNPFVTRKKDSESLNIKWNSLLLGKDLQRHSVSNVFGGKFDIPRRIEQLSLKPLNSEQLAFVKGLRQIPNDFILLRGPGGTGKTHIDITNVLLMLSQNKKVMVVSSSNEAANGFALKLLKAIEASGLKNKVLVRAHSNSTESGVIKVENTRFAAEIVQDEADQHWKTVTPDLSTYYDNVIRSLVEQDLYSPYGVRDRRYRLHQISLGSTIIRNTGLLDREPPKMTRDVPQRIARKKAKVPDVGKPFTSTAVVTAGKENPPDATTIELLPSDDDMESEGESLHSWSSLPLSRPTMTKEEMAAHKKANMSKAQLQMQELAREDPQEGYKRNFIAYFKEKEIGVEHDSEANAMYTLLFNELRNHTLRTGIDVLVTTMVNIGEKAIVDNFPANLGIIQEGSRTGAEILIALGNYQCPFYISGDEEQLGPFAVDTNNNIFASHINKSLFKRLVELNAPQHTLCTQYRMIPPIANLVSTIFYKGLLQTEVNLWDRPNVEKVSNVLKAKYDHEGTLVMFDIASKAEKVGPTRTKRNNIEVAAAIHMVEDLIAGGVSAADITLLTSYNAQVTLFKKQLASYSKLPSHANMSPIHVDTVDTMHGEENSVVVLTFVSTEDLGFMGEPQRLCVALSRARDALIIFHNATSVSMNLNRRSLGVYRDIVKYLRNHDCLKRYHVPTNRFFMEDDKDTILQREKDEYLSNKRYYNGVKAIIGPVQEDPVHEDLAPKTNKGKGREKLSLSTPATKGFSSTDFSPTEEFVDCPEFWHIDPAAAPAIMQGPANYDLTPEIDEHGQSVAGPSNSVALVQNRLVAELAKE